MTTTLLLLRHAKSDWEVPVGDRERPLAARGRRQAPATGRCLAAHGLIPELVLLSPATRARQTWDLIAAELDAPEITVVLQEAAYTFDGEDLGELVRRTDPAIGCLAIVGHNPAMEEVLDLLTGRDLMMPTAALAVVELADWASAGDGRGILRFAGRPADLL